MMLEWVSDFFVGFYASKCFNSGALIDRTTATNHRYNFEAREAQPVKERYRRDTCNPVRQDMTKVENRLLTWIVYSE